MKTVKLFRPVGPQELELIRDSGYLSFPPRLPEQPIFYPVCNIEYAILIAEGWNVRDSGAGFVTEFFVKKDFLDKYDEQTVGSNIMKEYWIPAEDLDEFNNNIVGEIKIAMEFH